MTLLETLHTHRNTAIVLLALHAAARHAGERDLNMSLGAMALKCAVLVARKSVGSARLIELLAPLRQTVNAQEAQPIVTALLQTPEGTLAVLCGFVQASLNDDVKLSYHVTMQMARLCAGSEAEWHRIVDEEAGDCDTDDLARVKTMLQALHVAMNNDADKEPSDHPSTPTPTEEGVTDAETRAFPS